MILTGNEISRHVAEGHISIDPFDEALLNPNSYNYRLGPTLLESRNATLDAASNALSSWRTRRIPPEGFVLQPGRYYLGTTVEIIGSPHFVPLLIGRSSMGRLGLFLQISADLGQLGAVHCWTLEMVAVQPLRVYAGMRIGQVSFWRAIGQVGTYSGYFGHQSAPTITPEGYNLT